LTENRTRSIISSNIKLKLEKMNSNKSNSKPVVLIIGGAGYIGSHVNKLLNQRNYDTVIFDNLIYGHRSFVKWGDFVMGDLENRDQLQGCFRKYPIYAVMHFGSFSYVGESVINPAKYYRNNVINTVNLLDTMLKFNVKHFIFSSSCAIYGNPQQIPITEDHPQMPINPYGWSKLMIEQILKDYDGAYGIRYVNLRYFNAAGADPDGDMGEDHNPETHLIPLVLDVAAKRKPDVKIFGTDYETADGTCIRDYIHVADLADAHILALNYLNEIGQSDSFNLGNGKGFSVRELIQTAQKVTGCSIEFTETSRREGDPPVLIGCSEKARKKLNWQPQLDDIETIIKTAWNWHQKKL
jgi:UDP-glucose 4-epimerase